MGAFSLKRIESITLLSEIVGYKSGLVLSHEEIRAHLPENEEILNGDDEEILRFRSEEFEEIVRLLLYKIGNIPSPRRDFPGIAIYHKYKDDPQKDKIREYVKNSFIEYIRIAARDSPETSSPINCTQFVLSAGEKFGPLGMKIAQEYVNSFIDYLHQLPWSEFRRQEWSEPKDLKELFVSESLATQYGKFFDQRFIDYLFQNFKSIDQINWRKFEGLTCEFFDRLGFYVQIGPGRNDAGIDARIWPKKEDVHLPPLIICQCKREKAKIQKVVVKALYADVIEEKAQSGLIITTSCLSPGANNVLIARSYPILQADRKTLQSWVSSMRSIKSGVFLGE